MHMVLALTALAVSFSFAGGDADAFAKSLSEATGKPVLMVSPTRQKFPAFEKTTETIRSLSNAVADAYDFQNGGTDDLGFSETSYPASIIANWPDPITKQRSRKVKPNRFITNVNTVPEADYKLTYKFGQLDASTVSAVQTALDRMPKNGISFFCGALIAKLPVVGVGTAVSQKEFFDCLAASVGATIDRKDFVPRLVADPVRSRTRLAGAFRACLPDVESATMRSRYRLAADVTAALDNDTTIGLIENGMVDTPSEGSLAPKIATIATAWIRQNFQNLPEKARTALSKMSGPSSRPKFSVRLGLDEYPRITVTDGTQTVEL